MKNATAKPTAAMATTPAPIPPTTAPVLIPVEAAAEEAALGAIDELVRMEDVVTVFTFVGVMVVN